MNMVDHLSAAIAELNIRHESDAKVIAALREASAETLAALDALEVGDANTRLAAAMAKLRAAAIEQTAGEKHE
jgi:hypothetical protein